MAVDTPQVQRGIAKWTFIATIVLGGLTYGLEATRFAYGLVFGVIISTVNFRVVGVILDVATREASPGIARIISFVGYHVRFWLIVVVLYLVIPTSHYLFGVGTFVGLLLPKVIMGVFVVLHTDDEWWNNLARGTQPENEVFEKNEAQSESTDLSGLEPKETYISDNKV